MGDEPQADLSRLARQRRQTLSAMRTVRDGPTVLTALVQRRDGTLSGLLNEIRAAHAHQQPVGLGVAAK